MRGHNPLARTHTLGAFDARPPVPLLDGLDTRPSKILDPPPEPVYQFSVQYVKKSELALGFGLAQT